MSTINTTTSSTIDNKSNINKEDTMNTANNRIMSKLSCVVTFDNIPSNTVSVLTSDYKDAISTAIFGGKTIIGHRDMYFVVDCFGYGYVTKVAQGDFYGYDREGVALHDFEVTIVTATDVANTAFASLAEVRAARGRAFEKHTADGWYLRSIIDAPDEWLDAIAKKQPEEARALKELKELQKQCAVAGRKASLSLRALEASGEAVELRTLDTHEVLSFTWDFAFDTEAYFVAKNDHGATDLWSLRDICLKTNILDII